jgi:hypothetical protein
MNRRLSLCLFVSTIVAAMGVFATACQSETGPDAPKRTNGCIAEDCYDAAANGTPSDASDQ